MTALVESYGGREFVVDCSQYWNGQLATGWFFWRGMRRKVQPIDEPKPARRLTEPGTQQFIASALGTSFRLFLSAFLSQGISS
ncbi:hypothetical protein ACIGHN_03805 [Acidovorax sp. NPDC077693]|uniref:hypothetical protein n=1 Tax=unclassified Acidovorax TaxID=2684926 RepID=UPI0037C919AE